MIGIEEQIEGIKELDKQYICYLKEGDFWCSDEMYERSFAFIVHFVGIKKLTEIYFSTSGTKQVTRKAQIKYMFDNIYSKHNG